MGAGERAQSKRAQVRESRAGEPLGKSQLNRERPINCPEEGGGGRAVRSQAASTMKAPTTRPATLAEKPKLERLGS